jgi:hypothetical protein
MLRKSVGVLIALGVLLAVVSAVGVVETEPTSVTPHPTDEQLQREDTVTVVNASGEFAADLRLITHRADALAGNDDTVSNFTLAVGGSQRFSSPEPRVGTVPRLNRTQRRTAGFNQTVPESRSGPLALVDAEPGSRDVTVLLPSPDRLASLPATTYGQVIAHEMEHLPYRSADERTVSITRPVYTDTILASRAVREGVAEHTGARYVEMYSGDFDRSAPNPEGHWRNRLTSALYYEGYRYAEATGLRENSGAEITSTAELLHPTANRSPGALPDRQFARQLDGVTEPMATNRLGELLVRELLVSRGEAPGRAGEVAAGWRNGRIDRYDTPDGTVTVWTTVWANETAAATFARVYETNVPTTRVGSFDRGQCGSTERLLLVDGRRVTVVRCS